MSFNGKLFKWICPICNGKYFGVETKETFFRPCHINEDGVIVLGEPKASGAENNVWMCTKCGHVITTGYGPDDDNLYTVMAALSKW